MKINTLNTKTGEHEMIDVGDINLTTPLILDEEIDADLELYNAINSATTVSELKAALLGKNGLARVKGKLK